MKFIDLFAGVGGFHLAFESEECVFASEVDKYAAITYKLNFPNTRLEGDITKIHESDIPAHDILCAGFPCQPFSIAGYRKGFEDTRGTLFFYISRIIKYHKPKVVLLENVKNLESHDKGNTLNTIIRVLEELNYYVYYKVLNSSEYANVAQSRERIFIVAFNKAKVSNYLDFIFPDKEKLTTYIYDFMYKYKHNTIFCYNNIVYYNLFNKYKKIIFNYYSVNIDNKVFS